MPVQAGPTLGHFCAWQPVAVVPLNVTESCIKRQPPPAQRPEGVMPSVVPRGFAGGIAEARLVICMEYSL